MNRYLLIGGNAISGQAALAGIREMDKNAYIYSSTSKDTKVSGADSTFTNLDLTHSASLGKVLQELKGKEINALVYIPARGTVGRPVNYVSPEEYEESLKFSVLPMLTLMRELNPRIGVWLSGFMWLKSLMRIYGPMTYTKITMEEITLQNPEKLKIIRYGMFKSDSTRGISILAQKMLRSGIYPELNEIESEWRASGKKFKDFFSEENLKEEETVLQKEGNFTSPYRPLELRDIQSGIQKAIFHKTKPILNLVGDWYWENDSLPDWPEEIKANLNLIEKWKYSKV
ncbi:MAG: hypothetical protein KDK54_13570 [Leptospiraceae bacterium]|nr:hypothetical protein [Leptospiraceae bacterium]